MIIVKPSPELMAAKAQNPVWIESRQAYLNDLPKGVAYQYQDAELLSLKQEHEALIRAGYIQINEPACTAVSLPQEPKQRRGANK